MSSLFLLNSNFNAEQCSQLKPWLSENDEILCIEDAVYSYKLLKEVVSVACYCLKNDLIIRGVNLEKVEKAQLKSYEQFVELTAKHDRTISWSPE